MSWTPRYDNEGIAAIEPNIVHGWRKRIEASGLADKLHSFAADDLAHDLAKHRLLLAYNMGLGKTAAAIVSAAVRGTKHSLFVVPNKLIDEWRNEFARLGLQDEYQIITSLSQIDGYVCPNGHGEVDTFQTVVDGEGKMMDVRRECQTCGARAEHEDRLVRYNIISLRSLWTIPKDSPHAAREQRIEAVKNEYGQTQTKARARLKYSFAWYLRRRVELVAIDEAYNLANPDTLQTRAVFMLKPKRRMLLTGTPVRGFPSNILSLLNWCLGTGSDLFPAYDNTKQASVQKFIDTFGTKLVKRLPDGRQTFRYIPRISNPERFQVMLAPVMRRRVNLEPEVAAAIKMPSFVIVPEQIELDPNLRGIYEAGVKDFVGWWKQINAEAIAGGKTVPQMSLLSKLTWLAQLAAVPQRVVPDYDQVSAKQQRIIELIHNAHAQGRKVLLLTEFAESAEWYASCSLLAKYKPTLVTGSVSLDRSKKSGVSARDKRMSAFREGDSELLVGTTGCMAEGLNIPQAGTVIFDSYPWVPTVQQQAWSRLLRPAQKHRPVEIYLVSSLGTIDDYLSAICAIKRAAIGEGIDYETVEFDLDDVPDPTVYANSLVESSGNVAAAYGALAWIERLKAQAAQAQNTPAAA